VQEENNLRNLGLILISRGPLQEFFNKIERDALGMKF
jgi:hypothetical protein